MQEYRVNIIENGRIIIPAQIRQKMQIKPGDQLLLKYDNNTIEIVTIKQAIKNVQDIIKKYNRDNISLTKSLKESRGQEND